MTTWYFDSVNGLDANDGLTPETAKQKYTITGTVAGDTFLFKRGTTQTVTASYQAVRNGTSETGHTRYGAYGEADVPYSIWKYGAASGSMILNASQSKYIDFEDMYFDMTGSNCRYSILFASQSGTETVGNSVRRCFFQGADSASRIGSGLDIVQQPDSSAVWPRDFVVEDCEFFDNASHGLIIVGGRNIIVRRCKFYRNGAYDPDGGHGFSSRWNRTDATSGWTNTSSTIWQRTLAAVETDVYYVQTNVAAHLRLRRTAGSQTAPAAGEFGVSAGVLYINAASASNPSTQAVRYAWGRCSGLVIEDCEAYDNYWNEAAGYHEGHGFAFDDFTEDSQFIGNKSYNNQGVGFSVNRGDRNIIRSNIAYGNWQSAVMMNPCDDLQVVNNTFQNNNGGTGAYPGEVFSWGYSKDAVISNNILLPIVSYGIAHETTDTGFSGEKNCITGHTVAEEKNATVTGTVTAAPLLDAEYRPAAPELKRAGAALGGKDFYGKQFYDTPNIGAVDDVTANPRYTLRHR